MDDLPETTEPGLHDNVLVIVGDDFGQDRIATYEVPGSNPAQTPVLDALAEAGVRFTRAYSQHLCSPSRLSMLSGRLPFRDGIGSSIPWEAPGRNGDYDFDLGAFVSLPAALNGTHATAAFGKWHLSTSWNEQVSDPRCHAIDLGFDTYFGTPNNLGAAGTSADGYHDAAWDRGGAGSGGDGDIHGYAPSVMTDRAVEWIDAQGSRPWFAWLAFHSAHTPLHAPPAHLTHSPLTDNSPPQELHKGMVEALDTEIGRLLTSIRPDVLARTWIVFVSDNGDPPTAAKGAATWPPSSKVKPGGWEGNVRMPLIVKGPGVADPGRVSDELVHLVDLFGTVCDLAGTTTPDSAVDSVSLMPVLSDPAASTSRQACYAERFHPNGFGPRKLDQWYITDGRWKLMLHGPRRLYDLSTDPRETHNLFAGSLTPEEQKALETLEAQREAILAREP